MLRSMALTTSAFRGVLEFIVTTLTTLLRNLSHRVLEIEHRRSMWHLVVEILLIWFSSHLFPYPTLQKLFNLILFIEHILNVFLNLELPLKSMLYLLLHLLERLYGVFIQILRELFELILKFVILIHEVDLSNGIYVVEQVWLLFRIFQGKLRICSL